ncbi:hypothetical protein TrLO_g4086 [Triparma laevis f. longispina]|uniref:lipoyl(octanoyl) transferase n=1 Tax=Triparma laevis f. longispina TaxID=1714387 RepID=A0A9W7F9X2_9STRA|nr:hypothetical protein TrLO_g4086 [Triparma laevis f. longispina]
MGMQYSRFITLLFAAVLLAPNSAYTPRVTGLRRPSSILFCSSSSSRPPQALGVYDPLPSSHPTRTVTLHDYTSSPSSYADILELQEHLLTGEDEDHLIVTIHEPTYTTGTSTPPSHLPPPSSPTPTIPIKRGGSITYHGPGQLVLYPILSLSNYKKDVHWYIRALEEVSLRAGNLYVEEEEVVGVREGFTGIFYEDENRGKFKIGQVGVRIKKWRTMHGVSVNVEGVALEGFEGWIKPCGIEDVEAGYLDGIRKGGGVEEFKGIVLEVFKDVFKCEYV